MRFRVISTRPSSEMSKTWVRVLSRDRRAAQGAGHPAIPVLPHLHVDEVDHDDAADVTQPELVGHLFGGLQVVAEDRLLQIGLAHVLAGVDVDHREGLRSAR